MSGFAKFPGSDVRAKLDHPVVDGDAHVLECGFAIEDFLKQIGGTRLLEKREKLQKSRAAVGRRGNIWWGAPSGPLTGDRAVAMLPRYFRSRMDEFGIDFAHCYTSEGLGAWWLPDDELRQATCRAINMLYAEMFADVGDRIRPAAVIPTYTPQEAIAELEFAVNELGHKAIMIGTEFRRDPNGWDGAPFSTFRGSIAMEPPFDYDPFWQRCIDLKVTPVCHTAARGAGHGYRTSGNYVFNHLGDFSDGAEYFCKSVLFGGVTHRFPTLKFGFLEGGVSWAQTLLNDIVEHWEKRNIDTLTKNLDPELLNVDLLAKLSEQFGSARLSPDRIRARPYSGLSQPGNPAEKDEFAACQMKEVRDLRRLFIDPFFFGCEADDRMMAVAFNRRLNPLGTELKAVFGSDIGHWDVLDVKSILSEAWSLVEGRLLTLENFRSFTFVNPAMLHLSMNPDYFEGTVVENEARKLLDEQREDSAMAALELA